MGDVIKNIREFFNTNETNIGYQDGYNQAISGNAPDYSGMVKKETIHKWLLGGNFAYQTYIDGYKKGYQKGLENIYSVQKVTIDNSDSFAQSLTSSSEEGNQNVMLSVIALVNLYNFLVSQCCNALQKIKGQMKSIVDTMESTGVAVELCQALREEYFPKDFNYFDAIHDAIVSNDLRMIADFIDKRLHTYYVITGESQDVELKQPIDIIDVDIDKPNGIDIQYQELRVRAIACGRLIASLEAWTERLISDMEMYDEYCDQLLSAGMPREYYDEYIERCAIGNATMMQSIIDHFKLDIDYLNNVYQNLAQV